MSGSRQSNGALTYERRLQKEMTGLIKDPPPGITIDTEATDGRLDIWHVKVTGAAGTLYEGEHFVLQFKFGKMYPFDSPEVMFVGDHIPVHPHIYSNGHICLSILTTAWSPALSVGAVCNSILSMLSSCKEKSHPQDNMSYIKTNGRRSPKDTAWWYHDDSV